MARRICSTNSAIICALVGGAALAQQPGAMHTALQQRLGEINQSITQNQARLRQYAWTETIEISLKGDVKKRNQNACVYGPDGTVQKTPIGEPPPQSDRRKGRLKQKMVANKVDELKNYMDRVNSLLRRYIPPNSESMQAAVQAGDATLEPGSGALMFNDYVKPGDKVTLTFNSATKKLLGFAVATYLDQPTDTVSISARFASLPDGTNFVEESVLDAGAKTIQVKTTNFDYHKTGNQ